MLMLTAPEKLTPEHIDQYQHRVFVGGSIEQGSAPDWQPLVAQALADEHVLLCNPRRNSWDATWSQSADFAPFRQQVEWELTALEASTIILLHFAANTRSPISLLELGLFARSNQHQVVVSCEPGFWRQGNVEIVADWYGHTLYNDLSDALQHIKQQIQ